MIATLEPSLLDQWRRRLGGRRRTRPRPWAALGCLVDAPVVEGLVEIENLTLVVLYDEPLPHGRCALRLAGYSASPIPWGVRFGGSDQCRFVKDLWLQPVPGGQGYRLDLAGEESLALWLQLERELDRCTRFCRQPLRESCSFGGKSAWPTSTAGSGPPHGSPGTLIFRERRRKRGINECPLFRAPHSRGLFRAQQFAAN
jgi:hypothetical protein